MVGTGTDFILVGGTVSVGLDVLDEACVYSIEE